MGPRVWCALALGSVLVLAAPAARGQARRAPPTDLVYTRGPWTQGCGDVQALERAAAQELGYDPFDEAAARKLRVSIGWRDGKLIADMGLWDEAGKNVWVNVIATTSPCPVLVDAVGLSIALRMRPRPEAPAPPAVCPPVVEAPKPRPVCEAAPAPEPPPPALVAPLATPTPPEVKSALSFRAGAMVWGGQVTTDRAAVGGTVDLGIRYKWFGGEIEARVDPPLGAVPLSGVGKLNYARATGALLLCVFYEWFVGCAKGEEGGLLFLDRFSGQPLNYAAVGVRLGLDFPVVPRRFFIRVAGEALGPIDPAVVTRVAAMPQSVFQVAGTNLGLGVGVLFALDNP